VVLFDGGGENIGDNSSAIRNALKFSLHDVTSRAPSSYRIVEPVHILHMDLQQHGLYSKGFALRCISSTRNVLRRSEVRRGFNARRI